MIGAGSEAFPPCSVEFDSPARTASLRVATHPTAAIFSRPMPSLDAILRANPEYVDSLYRRWLADPASVDATWGLFFAGYQLGGGNGAGNGAVGRPGAARGQPASRSSSPTAGAVPEGVEGAELAPALRVYDLVYTYRTYGHLIADLDPLGRGTREHPLLELSEFGFTEDDLDQEVRCSTYRDLQEGTLAEFLESLRETYCGTIGVEYMEVTEKEQRDWLQEQMEPVRNHPRLDPERKREILRQLIAADTFEETIHRRYPGAKRFSLEGGTTLVPMLQTMVSRASEMGVAEIVMGMAHRGRLNVLAHVLGKPYTHILAEFEGRPPAPEVAGYGDVKYHLGYSRDVAFDGRKIHLSLAFNPSHLEAVDPVVEGIVRGKQAYFHDDSRERAIPLLMHGDAAFAGQGVVTETLMLGGLEAYDDRRHRPRHHQQPDRLHDRSRGGPLDPLRLGHRQGRPGARVPRQRRRRRGRGARGAGSRSSTGSGSTATCSSTSSASGDTGTTSSTIPRSCTPRCTSGSTSIPRTRRSTRAG